MDSLDLHDTRHADVQSILDSFIHKHINLGTPEVTIITGKSDEMKKVVRDILEDYSMTAEDSWNNYGALTVKMV